MKRKIKVCGDRVLVKLKPVEQMSSGGIIMTNDYVERSQYATQEAYVVGIGESAWLGLGTGNAWCKVGDLVKILKYSGEDDTTIEDNAVYKVISDENILCVFEGEGLND
jgi:co-chaperonin GroES (HSP10)